MTNKSVVSVGEVRRSHSDNFFVFRANLTKLVQILLIL